MSGTENFGGRRVVRLMVKRTRESDSDEAETKKVKKNDYLEAETSSLGNEDEEVLHPVVAGIEYIVKGEEGESSVSQYQEWANAEYNLEGDGVKNEEIIVPIFASGDHQVNAVPEVGDEFLQFCQSAAGTPEKNYHCTEASCTASFRTRKSLRIHQLSSHGSFHCMRCKFETNCAQTLAQHGLQMHSLRIPFSCINSNQDGTPCTVIYCFWSYCNFKVEKEESIIVHVMKDHLGIPMKAKKILASLKNVESIMEGITPKLPSPLLRTDLYKCFHCDIQKDSHRNVALHETRNHSSKLKYNLKTVSGKPKNILVCARPGCAWKFAEEEHLVLHILQCHEGIQLNQWEEDELSNANDVISKLVYFKSETSEGENEDKTHFEELRPTSFECPSCTEIFSDECQLVAHDMLVHKLPISDTSIFSQDPNSHFFPSQLTHGSSTSMNMPFGGGVNTSVEVVEQGAELSPSEVQGRNNLMMTNQILEFAESTPNINQMQAVSSYPDFSWIQKATKDKRQQIEVLSREKVTVLETKPIKFSPRNTPKN